MKITKLQNTIQKYDWGSTTMIPELLGMDNSENTPMAEIWMGAHPKAPSGVLTDAGKVPLDSLIRESPVEVLGGDIVERFGAMLPFLFKVLAAGKPLSIQSHPNKEQAKRGFERENAQGIPFIAPHRNYADANHKPEIICALTPFWAMCGFRSVDEVIEDLFELRLEELAALVEPLAENPSRGGLIAFFKALLNLDTSYKTKTATAAANAVREKKGDRFVWVSELYRQFPGDIGVLCPLLLNMYHLSPGQALYLDAGELHAYLAGLGIELMANSDNVLRGGLTSKHIDVAELLGTLTFNTGPKIVMGGKALSETETSYFTPAEEFLLSRIRVSSDTPHKADYSPSVELYISVEGDCAFHPSASAETCHVSKGESVLVPASERGYIIEGNAVLYKATVPRA